MNIMTKMYVLKSQSDWDSIKERIQDGTTEGTFNVPQSFPCIVTKAYHGAGWFETAVMYPGDFDRKSLSVYDMREWTVDEISRSVTHPYKKLSAGSYNDRKVIESEFEGSKVFIHIFKDGTKYFQYDDKWLNRDEAYNLCGAFYCGLYSKECEAPPRKC